MKLIARRFRMKSGKWCVLRSPEPEDAAQRIAYLRRVNGETRWMARGAEDSPRDAEPVRRMIEDQLDSPWSLEIAAWIDGRMIACGGIGPASAGQIRRRHRAQLGIAVLKEFWGQGIGGEVLKKLLEAAPEMGYTQAELSVADGNDRARALYGRFGFREMGRIPNALRYEDGSFADEILMVRVFD